jgi:hypothetical protein
VGDTLVHLGQTPLFLIEEASLAELIAEVFS